MSFEPPDKIKQLIEKHTDRELLKKQKDLAAANERIAELEKQVVELKESPPEVQTILAKHHETVKIHSERARSAIVETDEIRRENILLHRRVSALEKELDATSSKLADLATSPASPEPLPPMTVVDSAKVRVRRSRRGQGG